MLNCKKLLLILRFFFLILTVASESANLTKQNFFEYLKYFFPINIVENF